MALSIKKTYDKKVEHEKAAETLWEQLALAMQECIPKSCRTFADSLGWIRAEEPEFHGLWRLPKSLEEWVCNMEKHGFGGFIYFREDDLNESGFKNFAQAQRKLRELARAWRGLIRIRLEMQRMDNGEVEKITMHITLDEFKKKEAK